MPGQGVSVAQQVPTIFNLVRAGRHYVNSSIMNTKKEITFGIRLVSMLVDQLIVSSVVFILVLLLMMTGLKDVFHNYPEQTGTNTAAFIYGIVLGLTMYFNKDFFNGMSPAKRIFNLQVINHRTNKVASPLRCLVRNLTVLFLPLEVIFILINTQRRFGDYVAGTRIVKTDQERIPFKRNFRDCFFPVGIGILSALLLGILVKFLISVGEARSVDYEGESYNPTLSAVISPFLSYRFRVYCDSASVRIYDKIDHDSLRYITMQMYLKNGDCVDNYNNLMDLEKMVLDTLNLIIPKESFVLNGKIIYTISGYTQIKYINYDPRAATIVNFENRSGYINDSTKIIKGYYKNGKPESAAIYVHERLNGTYQEWYENGKIKTTIEYQDGQRSGITTNWFDNGQKESALLYENNTFVRYLNRWDKSGNSVSEEDVLWKLRQAK
jgi:antitoxin component YwqK of YwqJK toxin-antitoxin module/uncharacterized RDD family membrane protein YckC